MSLARKGASIFLANWFLLPLQLVTSIFVVRMVGADGKGILTLLTTTVTLLATLGQLGLPVAAVYFVKRRVYSERTLLVNYLLAMTVVCLAIAMLAFVAQQYFIALFLDGDDINPLLLYLAFANLPCLMLVAFISNLHLANGRTTHYAWINVGIGVLNAVLTFVFVVVAQLGVAGALTAGLLSSVLFTGLALGNALGLSRGQPTLLGWPILRDMLKFGGQQYVGSLGAQMFKRLDSFLLALFLDVSAVGYYSVAVTAYDITLSIPRALNALLTGEAAGRRPEQAAQLVAQVTRHMLCLMLLTVIGLAGLSPWLIPLLYGPDFAQSVLPLIILLVAAMCIGVASNLQSYFAGYNRPDLNGAFTLIAGFVNLALSLWLIPTAGIVGNALATLLGALVSVALHLIWFQRLSKLSSWLPIVPVWDDVSAWSRYIHYGLQRVGLVRAS